MTHTVDKTCKCGANATTPVQSFDEWKCDACAEQFEKCSECGGQGVKEDIDAVGMCSDCAWRSAWDNV